ncbi:DUF2339 domain-containing protein [Rhizobium helianthi]|uniref:DUF2339 domain-containing protein n=1 Tax=Rhizobium helianthi TaxID=1132695 RepID=A0ABW4M5D4_9HYPH
MLELLVLIAIIALFSKQQRQSRRLTALELQIKHLQEQLAEARPPLVPAKVQAMEEAETGAAEALPAPEAAAEARLEEQQNAPKTAPPLAARTMPEESLESRLGARWAVWVGGLALALGGIFLVRYSIDAGLLGPVPRLILAALFGLALATAGEMIRRGALPKLPENYNNALVPGILTAAASITLMATVYTAFAIYDFIGPLPAFILLSLVALVTLALSLLHGQALAGLGLVASLLTPILASSGNGNFYALFGYLSLVWLAATAAARIRRWRLLPSLANILLMFWVAGSWSAVYLTDDPAFLAPPTAPGIALMIMIAGSGFLWPGAHFESAVDGSTPSQSLWRRARRLLARSPKGIMISVSLATMLSVLSMVAADLPSLADPVLIFVAVTGCLAGLGAGRRTATIPAIFAGLTAVWGLALFAILDASRTISPHLPEAAASGWLSSLAPEALGGLILGGVFTICGVVFIRRHHRIDPDFSALWAILASAVPIALATISFINYGHLGRDWLHAIAMLVTAAALFASAISLTQGNDNDSPSAGLPRDLLSLGAFGALALALHCLTQGLTTTVGIAILGFLFVLANLWLRWRGLPWAMIAAIAIVFVRIAWEPTIVGAQNLSTTPVFNALLAGYGIPAGVLIISAWLLRSWPGRRTLNAIQGLAALMTLLTMAILVRHAMQGGVLNDAVPTLGEQSIYTLLLVGLSGILMTLDFGSPSRAFRYGSMAAGILATLNILSLHLGALNPYFTDENVGNWPLINLLLPGYLIPALAYAGLAAYARGRRPQAYVVMLAVTAAILGFAWATLTVRWAWQGPHMAYWKGFIPAETYTYSVVWLLIGVGLLALGSRFAARSLRLTSAALVLIAVCKAFLIDMSSLEGILRALSFIGLGVVLIGIGLFYQKLMARDRKSQTDEVATG